MSSRTRLFPRDLSEPEPLKDHQVEGLKKVLEGFRHLYQLLDDVLPTGEAKESAVASLVSAKKAADEVIRTHSPRLTFKRMAELFTHVEIMDRTVSKVVVNIYTFADMRSDLSLRPHLELGTTKDELKRGLSARFMGRVEVYVNKKIPVGKVVVIADDEDVEIGPDWSPAPVQLEKI